MVEPLCGVDVREYRITNVEYRSGKRRVDGGLGGYYTAGVGLMVWFGFCIVKVCLNFAD